MAAQCLLQQHAYEHKNAVPVHDHGLQCGADVMGISQTKLGRVAHHAHAQLCKRDKSCG